MQETYEAGEFLIRQGDDGNDFFVIEEGEVVCSISSSTGPDREVKTEHKL